MNSMLSTLPERAMQLASQVGGGIRDAVPDKALKWVETGAALGALKAGSKVATRLVRRNPAVAVAAAIGGGLLLYAVRRRARQAQNGAIDGQSTRIEAKRGNGSAAPKKTSARKAARKPAAAKTTARKRTARTSARS